MSLHFIFQEAFYQTVEAEINLSNYRMQGHFAPPVLHVSKSFEGPIRTFVIQWDVNNWPCILYLAENSKESQKYETPAVHVK